MIRMVRWFTHRAVCRRPGESPHAPGRDQRPTPAPGRAPSKALSHIQRCWGEGTAATQEPISTHCSPFSMKRIAAAGVSYRDPLVSSRSMPEGRRALDWARPGQPCGPCLIVLVETTRRREARGVVELRRQREDISEDRGVYVCGYLHHFRLW